MCSDPSISKSAAHALPPLRYRAPQAARLGSVRLPWVHVALSSPRRRPAARVLPPPSPLPPTRRELQPPSRLIRSRQPLGCRVSPAQFGRSAAPKLRSCSGWRSGGRERVQERSSCGEAPTLLFTTFHSFCFLLFYFLPYFRRGSSGSWRDAVAGQPGPRSHRLRGRAREAAAAAVGWGPGVALPCPAPAGQASPPAA